MSIQYPMRDLKVKMNTDIVDENKLFADELLVNTKGICEEMTIKEIKEEFCEDSTINDLDDEQGEIEEILIKEEIKEEFFEDESLLPKENEENQSKDDNSIESIENGVQNCFKEKRPLFLMMDIELLISKVFEKPPLWDKRDKLHANRNVVDRLWTEVSKELNCEEIAVKKKWKYLRDQFAAELKKLPTARSEDAAGDTQTSKWHYFHLLHFLKDVVKPRASTGNFSSVLASNAAKISLPRSPEQENEMDDIDPPLISEENTPPSPLHTQDIPVHKDELNDKQSLTSVPSVQKKKGGIKRLKAKDFNHTILDIERQKMQYLLEKSSRKQDKDDDEDLMFFKSLLPYVKRIPPPQKLACRCRIQEIVQQFAYQVPIAPPLPHSYGSSASVSTPQPSPHCYTDCPLEPEPYPPTARDVHSCAQSPTEYRSVPTSSHNVTLL